MNKTEKNKYYVVSVVIRMERLPDEVCNAVSEDSVTAVDYIDNRLRVVVYGDGSDVTEKFIEEIYRRGHVAYSLSCLTRMIVLERFGGFIDDGRDGREYSGIVDEIAHWADAGFFVDANSFIAFNISDFYASLSRKLLNSDKPVYESISEVPFLSASWRYSLRDLY